MTCITLQATRQPHFSVCFRLTTSYSNMHTSTTHSPIFKMTVISTSMLQQPHVHNCCCPHKHDLDIRLAITNPMGTPKLPSLLPNQTVAGADTPAIEKDSLKRISVCFCIPRIPPSDPAFPHHRNDRSNCYDSCIMTQ